MDINKAFLLANSIAGIAFMWIGLNSKEHDKKVEGYLASIMFFVIITAFRGL